MYDKSILQETADILFRKHYTLAVAESVTAGLLQAALPLPKMRLLFSREV